MSQSHRQVSLSNSLLRVELGVALLEDGERKGIPSGKARFKWIWSEDRELKHPMRLVEPITGKKVFNWCCSCTQNRVRPDDPPHKEGCNGIVWGVPAYVIRSVAGHWVKQGLGEEIWLGLTTPEGKPPVNCWMLCQWLPPRATEEDWRAEFGFQRSPQGDWSYDSADVDWAHYCNGTYEPVMINGGVLALPDGQPPHIETTKIVVRMLKHNDEMRERIKRVGVQAMVEQQTKEEDQQRQNMAEELMELFPMGSIPGKNGTTGVSWQSGKKMPGSDVGGIVLTTSGKDLKGNFSREVEGRLKEG